MEHTTIERFGCLEKEEVLRCLESELMIPNTCILESESPFWGYYERFTYQTKPVYLYFVLEGSYSLEKIWRIILKVRKSFNHKFDAVPGFLEIFDLKLQIIRFRNLDSFDHIFQLQQLFVSEGIIFHKKIRKVEGETGIIRLEKSFFLEPIGDMMYMDVFEPHHGYFIIPGHFSWTKFKEITAQVQFDINLLYFDAANAFFYENHTIIDMVRIYREDLTREKLFAIRNGFYQVINESFIDKYETVRS
jgi:hypothetical protein